MSSEKLSDSASSRFAAIVASSDTAIYSIDLDGIITSWNPSAERMFGYAAGEAVGQPIALIVPPDRLGEEEDLRRRISRGDRVDQFDTVRRRKDATLVKVSLIVSAIRTSQGETVGVSKIARDITELKEIEARLRQKSALIDLSHEPIFVWDFDNGIMEWNTGCELLYGYSRAEAIGRHSHELLRTIHPQPLADFLTALKAQRQWSGEVRQQTRDRREVIVESRQQVIEGDGAPRVLETNRDITEQKRGSQRAAFLAEAGAVMAASLEYETTLTTLANLAVPSIADWCAVDIPASDGKLKRLAVAHVDPSRVELIRTVQERYENPSSPYSPTFVVRTGTPALVPRITDEMIVAAARGDEERVRLVRSLGLHSYMCIPLIAHGRHLGALSLVTAQSDREYTEDDFRFAQEIASRAALAIDNALAYREARAADRLKDDFLITLSHELRTPLNAILGYARLLRSGMMPPERQMRAVETVERNATALTQIVEDVLDVSRIISGKIRLNIQPLDLPRVVKEAVESLQPAADAKQVRLNTIVDPQAEPISGDPDRLQQIIWNLVSNAVKFTPKGGLVQVRLERVNSHVEMTVTDTGVGIAPDFLPHLFERFRQGDSSTTRQYGGLGLGLAIARHLVELHGGTIHAASQGEGQGATFSVRLPLLVVHPESHPEERRVHPRSDARTSGPPSRLNGIGILVVDDDHDALALLREILEAVGARVTVVESATKALDRIGAVRPDAVIADIGLPGMDGFELIRRIRQLPDKALRHVPAAALTAYARSEDRVKSLDAGYQLHLAKPVDPAELIAAVAALVRRRTDDQVEPQRT